MAGRSKLWRVIAGVFVFVNVAGLAYAAAMGEGGHALTHGVILLAGLVVWQMPWGRQRDVRLAPQLDEQKMEYLQQSVDAIALEVERIGEKQRFAEKLRSAPGETPLKKEQ